MTKGSGLKKKMIFGCILVLTLILVGCVCTYLKGKDHDKIQFLFAEQTPQKGVVVYNDIQHDYNLWVPEKTKDAPLVVVLHGYGESAELIRQKTGFEKEANARGYCVAYVTGAPNAEDATSSNGWNSGIGESSNNDVAFLCAFVDGIHERYGTDRNRVFAVGFSNGAFMTHRLALEAQDTFNAVVSVAGMMPESVWDKRPQNCSVGIFQITGEKDDVVPKNSDGSAKYSKAPAIEDVVQYYVEQNGLALSETSTIGKKSILETYSSDDSEKQVWNLMIPDGRHSWPDENIVGFSVNEVILDYLETQ